MIKYSKNTKFTPIILFKNTYPVEMITAGFENFLFYFFILLFKHKENYQLKILISESQNRMNPILEYAEIKSTKMNEIKNEILFFINTVKSSFKEVKEWDALLFDGKNYTELQIEKKINLWKPTHLTS